MRKYQRGASMISIMVIMLIGASFLTLALKLIPVYIDSWTIAEAFEKVTKEENFGRLSDREIVGKIQSQLNINGVRDFDPKTIVVKRDKGKMILSADYEVRTHIVKNIDAVLSFKNQFETAVSRE